MIFSYINHWLNLDSRPLKNQKHHCCRLFSFPSLIDVVISRPWSLSRWVHNLGRTLARLLVLLCGKVINES